MNIRRITATLAAAAFVTGAGASLAHAEPIPTDPQAMNNVAQHQGGRAGPPPGRGSWIGNRTASASVLYRREYCRDPWRIRDKSPAKSFLFVSGASFRGFKTYKKYV